MAAPKLLCDYTVEKILQPGIQLPEQLQWLHCTGNLHPACYNCLRRRTAQVDGPPGEDGEPLYNSGDFILNCRGIPKDYTKMLPAQVWENMSHSEQERFLETQDPVYWAWKYLNWVPRVSKGGIAYQEILLKCTATRKMSRIGRRSGKTACLSISALNHAFLHSSLASTEEDTLAGISKSGDVIVVAPYGNQINMIFSEIRKLIRKSVPEIKRAIERDVKNPHTIVLTNGTQILGAPAGEKSGSRADTIRGQGGSLIIFDEMDYLENDSVETVMAILSENEEAIMWGSSTPKGRRDSKFYQFCNSPLFSEFHYPSQIAPTYSPRVEMEFRAMYDRISYAREVLAEWGEQRGGLFPVEFVDRAIKGQNYKYGFSGPGTMGKQPGWIYSMGVDWNQNTGTQIVVVGMNPKDRKAYVVDRAEVEALHFKQINSVLKVKDLNRIWEPDYIYVDRGFGATQVEHLHLIGQKAAEAMAAKTRGSRRPTEYTDADARLKDIVEGIDFKQGILVYDPSGEEVKKPAKQVIVQNTMRFFEQNLIHFPGNDEDMKKQLLAYVEQKVTAGGVPIYGSSEPKRVGDHIIDALFLAMWAITKNHSYLGGPTFSMYLQYSPRFGVAIEDASRDEGVHDTIGAGVYEDPIAAEIAAMGSDRNLLRGPDDMDPQLRQRVDELMGKKGAGRPYASSNTQAKRYTIQIAGGKSVSLSGPNWKRKITIGNNKPDDIFDRTI